VAQGERLTTATCGAVEGLVDEIRAAMVDGTIYPAEQRNVEEWCAAAVGAAAEADEAVMAAVTVLRRGPASPKARRYVRESWQRRLGRVVWMRELLGRHEAA
jgi:hypothetical protein